MKVIITTDNDTNTNLRLNDDELMKEFEQQDLKDKRWTTEEMKFECIYVIEQLLMGF